MTVLLLLLTLAALQRHGAQARPAAPRGDSLDPMDAYLRDMPDPPRHRTSPGGVFAASESIESPSRKLQHPDTASHEDDDGGRLPFGARLKPPRQYGAIVSKPPPLLADDKARSAPEKARQTPQRTRPAPAKGAARSTGAERSPDGQGPSTTARPRLAKWTPPNIVIDSRRTRPLPPPPTPPPSKSQAPKFQAPQSKRRQPQPTKAKTSPLPKARKAGPSADSFNRTRTAPPVNGTNGTLPGNPKPQASFFFTNVGPNHFEYRGVFDPNAVPISFRDNPETLFQLIPQLPRLFDDPFTPPKSPPTQLLLQPPPKLIVDHPPPPPLTLFQPVLPERQLFPKYDYIRGPQYPKIFKFNDERISILEFERSKREGRFVKRRGDSLDPDRVARSNFLIFHGGLFNAQRRPSNGGGFGNVVSPPRGRSEPLFAPYKSPYEPLPPPPVEYLPVKPTFAKNKPGGFVYFIRT
ncbi:hypothetical protein IscW_ISCW000398 [Ixodes scapularis]|uniref:Uncharacterized protein n=1 Tax=Ixodes scapularis TaxID=6945 RepID=B7P5N5_IXOSC|nr:hypothetical protein IscW_ISCW000398 [Ixodes scapularis]|eukprot:XP_002407765.1 hypothetical protein IscW_ISCW000398 [Ixodes scapularis]